MRHQHLEEHDRLRVMIDAYIEMLRCEIAPDIELIMKRRLAFSTAYLAHIANEGVVFNRLRTGDPDHPADRQVNEYACRLRDIMPGYSALIQQWTPQRIVAEWAAYRTQVLAQIRRYDDYLRWEEAEMLPLLDRHEPVRLAG